MRKTHAPVVPPAAQRVGSRDPQLTPARHASAGGASFRSSNDRRHASQSESAPLADRRDGAVPPGLRCSQPGARREALEILPHGSHWCAVRALPAQETLADEGCPPLRRRHPRSVLPGRIVSDVLRVAALQVRDPVTDLIQVEPHDRARYGSHCPRKRLWLWGCACCRAPCERPSNILSRGRRTPPPAASTRRLHRSRGVWRPDAPQDQRNPACDRMYPKVSSVGSFDLPVVTVRAIRSNRFNSVGTGSSFRRAHGSGSRFEDVPQIPKEPPRCPTP